MKEIIVKAGSLKEIKELIREWNEHQGVIGLIPKDPTTPEPIHPLQKLKHDSEFNDFFNKKGIPTENEEGTEYTLFQRFKLYMKEKETIGAIPPVLADGLLARDGAKCVRFNDKFRPMKEFDDEMQTALIDSFKLYIKENTVLLTSCQSCPVNKVYRGTKNLLSFEDNKLDKFCPFGKYVTGV
jgi:hypothetical protein